MIIPKVFEDNKLASLKSLLNHLNPKKIFLVRGNSSYFKSGAETFINDIFKDKSVTSFSEFDVNPKLDDLRKGVDLFLNDKYDLIVSIGGGSVLDMAKLISVFAYQENDFEDIIKGKVKLRGKKTKVLAIPTTAGTGAEATHFAVVYINKIKYSIAHEVILPDYVFLSSRFSLSASPYLTACTGLDAFCQAIESVWSINATDESMGFALPAIETIWNNLKNAVNNNDSFAKQKMQEAAFLAGKAINITKTTAPHALSYAFTSYYDIPHGHAVALNLPFFLNFNYNVTPLDCNDKRGVDAVKERIDKIFEVLNITETNFDERLIRFFENVGVNIKIDTLIKDFDENLIMENINTDRLSNNPRVVTKNIVKLSISYLR